MAELTMKSILGDLAHITTLTAHRTRAGLPVPHSLRHPSIVQHQLGSLQIPLTAPVFVLTARHVHFLNPRSYHPRICGAHRSRRPFHCRSEDRSHENV